MGKMKGEGYASFSFHLSHFTFSSNKRRAQRIMPYT